MLASATVLLVLTAAKAHGRLLRIEREGLGHLQVRFGGSNPPEVESLWRRDRIGFWSCFVGLGTASVVATARSVTGPGRVGFVLAGLAWAFASSFVVMGAASQFRRGADPNTRQGTVGWWVGVLATATLVAASAALAGAT